MAMSLENFGGTYLSALITRPEFLAYTSEAIFEQSRWIQSGIVSRNSALDARAGGTRVRVPFFDYIAPTEERIQSNGTWGTSGAGYLTPQSNTADEQIMTILHRGFAYAADDLSKLGSGADPLAHVRSQLAAAINKLKTQTLISQLNGLFATALASNELDASATSNVTATNYLTVANVLEAKNKLGERGERLSVIAMHSAVYTYLQQIGMLTFSSDSLVSGGNITWGGGGIGVGNTGVATFAGMRVVVDDQLTRLNSTGGQEQQMPVYLFEPGVISEGVQQDLRIEADRNILSLQDVFAVNYHYGYHVTGTKWTSGSDNPTNADLATNTNWSLAYQNVKNVPIVRLKVNTPFLGTI